MIAYCIISLILIIIAYRLGEYDGRREYSIECAIGDSRETLFVEFPHSFKYSKLKAHALTEVKKAIDEAERQRINFLQIGFNGRCGEKVLDFEIARNQSDKILECVNLAIDRINYSEKK